jgi:hypothetical protein
MRKGAGDFLLTAGAAICASLRCPALKNLEGNPLGGICTTFTLCRKNYLPPYHKNINTEIARKSLELLDDKLQTVAHASRLFPSLIYALRLVFGIQLRASEPSC